MALLKLTFPSSSVVFCSHVEIDTGTIEDDRMLGRVGARVFGSESEIGLWELVLK